MVPYVSLLLYYIYYELNYVFVRILIFNTIYEYYYELQELYYNYYYTPNSS